MLFIKRKRSNSRIQFEKDFGEYPPKPIANDSLREVSFNTIFLNKWNKKAFEMKVIFRLWSSSTEFMNNSLSSEIHEIKASTNQSINKSKDAIRELKNTYYSQRYLQRIIFLALILALSPFIITALLLAFLVSSAKIFYTIFKFSPGINPMGYFFPIKNDGLAEIVLIRRKRKNSCKNLEDGVLSHEHIHLMQSELFYDDPSRVTIEKGVVAKRKKALATLLRENYSDDNYIMYLFELNEVEARLHEVVLSHYRDGNSLPTSYSEFLTLLFKNDDLSKRICKLMPEEKKQAMMEDEFSQNTVITRFGQAAEELRFMLNCFVNENTAACFISNTLSVMYANLLLIYGAESDAKRFFNTIDCTDQYQFIYGEINSAFVGN